MFCTHVVSVGCQGRISDGSVLKAVGDLWNTRQNGPGRVLAVPHAIKVDDALHKH